MSFLFTAAGTVAQVRRQVAHAVESGTDRNQLDALQQFVERELERWPSSERRGFVSGVLVEARGNHDQRGRYLSLSLRPLLLPKEHSDNPPDEHNGEECR